MLQHELLQLSRAQQHSVPMLYVSYVLAENSTCEWCLVNPYILGIRNVSNTVHRF